MRVPPPQKNIVSGFLFGVVFRVFLLFGGFFWFFLGCFATVQLLNSYCPALIVGGGGFRVFFGFFRCLAGVSRVVGVQSYSFLH